MASPKVLAIQTGFYIRIRRQLSALAKEGEVSYEGEKRWRRYRTV